MGNMRISLFGKLRVRSSDEITINLEPRRAEELLCYLLLYRHRLHEREKLGALLWPDAPPGYSKRYLRQTLWQLQSALNHTEQPEAHLLVVDYEWIGINPCLAYWLDVALFEQTFAAVEDRPGQALCAQQADQLRQAVQLYQGDLLEGWYQDWCIYERERFQAMYLSLLDKLLGYSEAHAEYETGLDYGAQILRYDRAREQTHRQLMRLHYLAGNRTAAIHQYDACVAALRDELDVAPAKETVTLYKQIRAEQIGARDPNIAPLSATRPHHSTVNDSVLADTLQQIEQIQTLLAHLQEQVTHLAEDLRQKNLQHS